MERPKFVFVSKFGTIEVELIDRDMATARFGQPGPFTVRSAVNIVGHANYELRDGEWKRMNLDSRKEGRTYPDNHTSTKQRTSIIEELDQYVPTLLLAELAERYDEAHRVRWTGLYENWRQKLESWHDLFLLRRAEIQEQFEQLRGIEMDLGLDPMQLPDGLYERVIREESPTA